MKRLVLALILVIATSAAAFAGNGLTKSANDSAILAGHQMLVVKVNLLQSSLSGSNSAATQIAASDVLSLMRVGMMQGKARINLESTTSAQGTASRNFLTMEKTQYEYRQLLNNIAANGAQLISKANVFLSAY